MAYQLLQMYSSQQTFLIFLQYTPPVGCFNGHCVKIRNRCYEPCPTCPDLCHNTTKAERDACMKKYDYYFYSPSMEYRVKCIDFYKSVSIAEAQYMAVLIGNCFVGYIADKFGRRRMLLIALCAGIPFLVLSAVFDGVFAFYLFRFLLGLTIAGTMAVGWAYCAEMISPRHRFKLRTFTSWTNGRILMITFTFLGQSSWRLASYFNAAASLSTLAIIAFLPESPMWLKRKEKYDRERESREKMAWICGTEYVSEKETKKGPQPPTLSLLEMLQNPDLRTSFLTLSVMWFCAGLSMYAIDLNGEDMTENLWIGQFATAALASTIRVILGFADDRFDWLTRRLVYILSMGTCIIASAGLLYELLNGMKGSLLYFITYLVAYNSIAVSWEPNYMGAAELMPTEVRAKTTAFLNIISRVSNVIAARTVGTFKGTWEPATLIVVLASNIFSFIITFLFLKETKNIKLDAIGGKRDVEKGSAEKTKGSAETPGSKSKTSAETPGSKDTVTKDESKGESEEKKDAGSADKRESDDENKTDDARLQSDEVEKYNIVTEGTPKPLKPAEERASKEESKASKEEPKASKEEPKVSKEEPKASKEEPKVSKEEPKASKEGSKASIVESKEEPKQSQEKVSGDKQ